MRGHDDRASRVGVARPAVPLVEWSTPRRRSWRRRIETSPSGHGGRLVLNRCRVVSIRGHDARASRVAATRPAEPSAGRVPSRAPARGGVSRPLWAVAGGWPALGCCRVVSIRGTAFVPRAWPLRAPRSPPPGAWRRERPRGEVSRDHSGLSLGVGPGWAVAGRSRYGAAAFVPHARRLLDQRHRWSSGRRRDEGAGGDVSRPLQAVAGGQRRRRMRAQRPSRVTSVPSRSPARSAASVSDIVPGEPPKWATAKSRSRSRRAAASDGTSTDTMFA